MLDSVIKIGYLDSEHVGITVNLKLVDFEFLLLPYSFKISPDI